MLHHLTPKSTLTSADLVSPLDRVFPNRRALSPHGYVFKIGQTCLIRHIRTRDVPDVSTSLS